jgi:hypothetical protein
VNAEAKPNVLMVLQALARQDANVSIEAKCLTPAFVDWNIPPAVGFNRIMPPVRVALFDKRPVCLGVVLNSVRLA